MKSQFLKIAGVKSEKAFYKKYPTEAAFFKAHPEAKKMANGGKQDKGQIKKLQQLTDFGNPPQAWPGIDIDGDGIDDEEYGSGSVYGQPTYNPATTAVGGVNPNAKNPYQAATRKVNGGLSNTINSLVNNLSNIGQPKAAVQPATPAVSTTNTTTTINVLGGYQANKPDAPKANKLLNKLGPVGKTVGKIANLLKQQKQELQIAKQTEAVTDIYKRASRSKPKDIEKREYVRPEDMIVDPNQMFPSYGVGTNVLAQYGATIGGNPGEIANTFAPDTIYSDMGYEPLNDSDRLKAYYYGGKMTKAAGGGMFKGIGNFFKGGDDSKFADFMNNQGGGEMLTSATSQIGSGGYGQTAGNAIGGEVGELAGSLLPIPGGKFIGRTLGQIGGGLIDKTGKKIMASRKQSGRNINDIMYSNIGSGLQSQYGSFMEDGGYVSHDWTPQLITKFGEYNMEDLLQPPNDADMLRAGGHLRSYTPPSEQAMYTGREQFAMGGDLKVHRGEAETMSYNPYLPDGGETIMFRGPSHENGGMPIEYGSSPVEVEGGEPAVKLQDGGTGEDNMVVFGNLQIPNQFLSEIGDDKAKGKKFKNYVADLSKIEARQNKIIDNSSNTLDNLEVNTPFDKLQLDTMNANLMGANMKLKDLAEKKKNAAAVQSAINDTAEENGLVADDLARGKIKMDKSKENKAKYGAAIEQAQTGTQKAPVTRAVSPENYFYLQGLYEAAKKQKKGPLVEKFQKEYSRINPGFAEQVLGQYPITQHGKRKGLKATDLESNYDGIFGPRTERYMSALEIDRVKTPPLQFDNKPNPVNLKPFPTKPFTTTTEETTKRKKPIIPFLNELVDYFRPSDVEGLDPNQLMGEIYALSNNQLEPVQAQKYTPQLLSPYDISLQDQLNANQGDFNAIARMTGGDPSALSALAAQKYAANSKVLGEQMRLNQANKAGVYSQNINAMNDAQLRNLNILDQQYGRQAQAKSNTKATTQGALNSISSKIAQNKLANRTLATYENLYNYRYDPRFRAQNMNPLVDFESMVKNANPEELAAYSKIMEENAKKAKTAKTKDSRNGSIVKALKNL
jgi:hypothetical protein